MDLQQQQAGARDDRRHGHRWFGARVVLSLSVAAAALAGCGGGDDGTPPPTQVESFSLRAGVISYHSQAQASEFTVSGSCNGSATRSLSSPAEASFEGQSDYAQTMTTSLLLTDCTPASDASTVTLHTDADFNPPGWVSPGVSYGVNDEAPAALPTSTKVGDTAVQAVQTLYTDSSKATVAGQRVLSYAVESDTDSSVIVNFIERRYDVDQTLVFTEQQRLRLDDLGEMSMVSVDQQYTDEAKTHLLLTAK